MVYPTLLTMWGPNWEALYYKIASYNRINRNYVAEQPHQSSYLVFTSLSRFPKLISDFGRSGGGSVKYTSSILILIQLCSRYYSIYCFHSLQIILLLLHQFHSISIPYSILHFGIHGLNASSRYIQINYWSRL